MLASIKEAVARADFMFVALALGVYAVSVPIMALRWRIVLAGVTGRRTPLRSLMLATLASSFVNNVTPSSRVGGEACRVIALVRLRLATASRATVAIAYERLSEAPAVVAIALVTLLVAGRISLRGTGWLTALVAFGAGAVAVALLRPFVIQIWRGLRERWQWRESLTIAPSTLVSAAMISAVIWMLDVVRLRLAVAAFHAPIGLPQAATLAAITIVAGFVPTVGGLGSIEGGLIAGLVAFGVPPADAVGITAVERTISYGVATVAGLGALSLLGGWSLWNAVRVGSPAPEAAAT